MGRPPTIFFSSPKHCLAETFEMFYGGNREAGRAVVNSYCKENHHLQVPKPEQLLLPKPDLSLNLPPLKMPPQPKPCVPVQFQIWSSAHLLKNILYQYTTGKKPWEEEAGILPSSDQPTSCLCSRSLRSNAQSEEEVKTKTVVFDTQKQICQNILHSQVYCLHALSIKINMKAFSCYLQFHLKRNREEY